MVGHIASALLAACENRSCKALFQVSGGTWPRNAPEESNDRCRRRPAATRAFNECGRLPHSGYYPTAVQTAAPGLCNFIVSYLVCPRSGRIGFSQRKLIARTRSFTPRFDDAVKPADEGHHYPNFSFPVEYHDPAGKQQDKDSHRLQGAD
jgi:hypothetical protein